MREIDPSELDVKHHFGSGIYAKETRIPAGHVLVQHKHVYAHLSLLASGRAIISKGVAPSWIEEGPAVIPIDAGVHHRVEAVTDCVFFCIHATKEHDLKKIDSTLIVPSSREEMRRIGEGG